MSDAFANSSTRRRSGLAFFATLIGCALFVFIIRAAWVQRQPASLGDGIRTPAQRSAILEKLQTEARAASTAYAWIDQPKGIVRLPTDRAVALTIQELNAAQP